MNDDLRQPTGGLESRLCSLAHQLAATRRRPTFIQVTQVNSRNGFVIDDSTITSSWSLLLLLLFYWFATGNQLRSEGILKRDRVPLLQSQWPLLEQGMVSHGLPEVSGDVGRPHSQFMDQLNCLMGWCQVPHVSVATGLKMWVVCSWLYRSSCCCYYY